MIDLREFDEEDEKQRCAQGIEDERQPGQLATIRIDRIVGKHGGQHATECRHANGVDESIDEQLVNIVGKRIGRIGQPRD